MRVIFIGAWIVGLSLSAAAQDAPVTLDELRQDHADCQQFRLPDLDSPLFKQTNRYDPNTPCASIYTAWQRAEEAAKLADDAVKNPVLKRLREHAGRLHLGPPQ